MLKPYSADGITITTTVTPIPANHLLEGRWNNNQKSRCTQHSNSMQCRNSQKKSNEYKNLQQPLHICQHREATET